jgi:hypothetical protein
VNYIPKYNNPKTLKFPEENIRKRFLRFATKRRNLLKVANLNFIKMKNFCTLNNLISKENKETSHILAGYIYKEHI